MTDPIRRYAHPHPQRHHRAEGEGADSVVEAQAALAEVLADEGFIGHVSHEQDDKQGMHHRRAHVRQRQPTTPSRASAASRGPGQRTYARHDRMPRVRSGLGVAIVSTSKGVMTDRDARKQGGLGGELLCEVW